MEKISSKVLKLLNASDDENTVDDDHAKKRPRPTKKPAITKGAKCLFPPS
ncbi:hypothetical protein C2G38_2180686 [Gigaspora rosea]|uniref:Uncharacterized protein n=1 Tax=Gigaspora rosea TaxID=44941 RepID=A0A397VCZ1_9GLOM|nr:hypothetical protein C2G38_2180686 [Gigaspora rosea]